MRTLFADLQYAIRRCRSSAWFRGAVLLAFVTFPAKASTVALGVLGALAMMLAITGIFGPASYTVSRRTREPGIRAALGAQNRHVLRAALGRSVLLLGIRSIAGLALGFARAACSRALCMKRRRPIRW